MKKLILFFILFLFLPLSAQQKTTIAILNYEDRSGKIETDVLHAANDYLRMYLESVESYFVVSKEQQNATAPQASGCRDKLCRIQAGQNLGVNLIAYPYIASANGQYMINVEIIDVAKRSTTISVSESWGRDRDSLDSISESIARKIAVKQKNIDALNANRYFRENVPKEEPTFAETFKVVYNTVYDTQTCEKAIEKENLKLWQKYLKIFPEGQCAEEAKKFIENYPKKLDNDTCEKARKENSKKGWEKYLKEHPDGQCVQEAKTALDNIACEKARKKNDKKEWEKYLNEFPQGQCVEEAVKSLRDKEACKVLLEKNKKTQEQNYLHVFKGWQQYLNTYPNGQCLKEAKKIMEKCDREMCKMLLKKKKVTAAWRTYLHNLPEGQCANEGRAILDKDACEEAETLPENAKNRAWESYLQEFPNGKCAEEAKEFLEK